MLEFYDGFQVVAILDLPCCSWISPKLLKGTKIDPKWLKPIGDILVWSLHLNLTLFDCLSSVAPDTIHNHVKTYRDERRNMHFIAPEYGM